MSDKYILDEHHQIHEQPDLMKWARWMENRQNRIVCQEDVGIAGGTARVSTVFLGLDHRFGGGEGPPILFETMVFRGKLGAEQERACTWAEAVTMHEKMVELVIADLSAKVKS